MLIIIANSKQERRINEIINFWKKKQQNTTATTYTKYDEFHWNYCAFIYIMCLTDTRKIVTFAYFQLSAAHNTHWYKHKNPLTLFFSLWNTDQFVLFNVVSLEKNCIKRSSIIMKQLIWNRAKPRKNTKNPNRTVLTEIRNKQAINTTVLNMYGIFQYLMVPIDEKSHSTREN